LGQHCPARQGLDNFPILGLAIFGVTAQYNPRLAFHHSSPPASGKLARTLYVPGRNLHPGISRKLSILEKNIIKIKVVRFQKINLLALLV